MSTAYDMMIFAMLVMEEHESKTQSTGETEFLVHYLGQVLGLNGHFDAKFLQAVQLAMQNARSNEPTVEQLCVSYAETHCRCDDVSSMERKISACRHVIQVFKIGPSCEMMRSLHLYHLAENRYPSMDELHTMLVADMGIRENPERYCEEKKFLVPTPNLDQLHPEKNLLEDVHCSICQNQLLPMAQMFKLPCGCRFHAEDCLDSGRSILSWMQQCKKCPNCNKEIVLVPP